MIDTVLCTRRSIVYFAKIEKLFSCEKLIYRGGGRGK